MACSFNSKLALIAWTFLLVISNQLSGAITSYSKNDPFPVFTTLDPQTYLYTYERQTLKDLIPIRSYPERISISISPFGQNANKGRLRCSDALVELGDLNGKWNMIALLFGPTPHGQMLPPALLDARALLFPQVPPGTPIDDPLAISDPPACGFYTIPLCYSKRGCRFEFEAYIACDVGFKVQTGIADITQTVSAFINLSTAATCNTGTGGSSFDPNNPNLTANNINTALMAPCKRKEIFDQLTYDIRTFHHCSVEDIRGILYWRHAYDINHGRKGWPEFLLMPFFEVGGIVAAGRKMNPHKLFALPFGSNGFNAIGAAAGLTIDFVNTIEIGAEAGITHFLPRTICSMPFPNSECQSGIYPFTTDVHVSPGDNWYFGGKLSAYHFYDRLSFYLEYIIVDHKQDHLTLVDPDPAFLPEKLEKLSMFRTQLFNSALNYDISPNICLGILWQAPFKQQNSYRSTTVLFTFNVTF